MIPSVHRHHRHQNELFKIQQERENDLLKLQQERENELLTRICQRQMAKRICVGGAKGERRGEGNALSGGRIHIIIENGREYNRHRE